MIESIVGDTDALKANDANRDHCSIFILIAGARTPLALYGLCPENSKIGWGFPLFIWAVAMLGIALFCIVVATQNKRALGMDLYCDTKTDIPIDFLLYTSGLI